MEGVDLDAHDRFGQAQGGHLGAGFGAGIDGEVAGHLGHEGLADLGLRVADVLAQLVVVPQQRLLVADDLFEFLEVHALQLHGFGRLAEVHQPHGPQHRRRGLDLGQGLDGGDQFFVAGEALQRPLDHDVAGERVG